MSRNRDTDKRAERVPLGVPRQKLGVEPRDGYVGRWINDVDGRIRHAIKGDYELVADPTLIERSKDKSVANDTGLGTSLSKAVGTQKNGQPIRAYYMEIKKEFYDHDQRVKQQTITDRENSRLKGEDTKGAPGDGQRYLPSNGIQMDYKTGAG